MSQITLGYQPETLRLILVAGADFTSTLTNRDGDWSPTCVIELRLDDGTSWPATISGDTATWDIDKVAVDQVIAGVRKVALFYTDGAADLCWAKGSVTRA